MVKRIYICNVCRKEVTDGECIFGFEWKPGVGGDEMVQKVSHSCENHVCAQCLDNLANLHRVIRKQQVGCRT